MIKRALRAARHHHHEGGIKQVLDSALLRARCWISGSESWLIYRLDAAPKPSREPRLNRRELDVEELVSLGYVRALAFPEGLRGRIAQGSSCHGFFVDDTFVNVAWTRVGTLELTTHVVLGLGAGAGIYDCLTLPGHRGKGYYPESLQILATLLFQSGSAPVDIAVDPGNRPSIKGIEAAGFRQVGLVTMRTQLGRRSISVTGPLQLHQSNAD